MKLRQLLEGIEVSGGTQNLTEEVSSVCYAAHQCVPGSVFVAIPGTVHDGHDFIAQAIERGARFIVHQKNIVVPEGVVAFRVADSRRALGVIAKNYYRAPSAGLTLIGVTGTSGKTTVSYLLESILNAAGFCPGVIGTVNYRYKDIVLLAPNTTPESLDMQKIMREMADAGVTHVIAEVSSHALDLKRVDECDFDLGIFTNLSPEHLDYHKDMEDYFQAKKRFFTEILPQSKKNRPRKAVINTDDPWGRRLLEETRMSALSYGLEGDAQVTARREDISLSGVHADIFLDGESVSVSSGLIGRFNLSNMLAAAAAASIVGISPAEIAAGISSLMRVPGRMEKIDTSSGIHVFVDYAHKPDALKQALEGLARLKRKRIITVFGCGGDRDRAKRPLMGQVATRHSDLTIVTSDNPRREDPLAIIAQIEAGIDRGKIRKIEPGSGEIQEGTNSYMVIAQRKAAIEEAIDLARAEDIVLIAGKGHENYQILQTGKIPFDDRTVAAEALQVRFPAVAAGAPVFLLAEAASATGGRLVAGDGTAVFHGISTDTRTLKPGNLFIALTGENFDGHAFAGRALEKGAAGIMISAPLQDEQKIPENAFVIEVEDTLRALGDLAQAYRRRFTVPVAGITGSSGKTTTKEMLTCILKQDKKVLTTQGNLNNLIGLPQTIFRLAPGHEIAVLEMGSSLPGEIKRLTEIAAPDIGLITNIGPAHLAGFKTLDAVREEKGDLFLHMKPSGIAVVNLDDPAVSSLADRRDGRRVTFSLQAGADVSVEEIRKGGARGTAFNLLMGGKSWKVDLKAAGIHNVYNAMAAAAAAIACGAGFESIQRGLASFVPVGGRMEIIRLQNGGYLIDDSYNANPASMREALLTLKDLKGAHDAFVFLGDMLELGDEAADMHRRVGMMLATIGVKAAFLRGDFAGETASGAKEGGLDDEKIMELNRLDDGITYLKKHFRKGGWILVKGSRSMKMETVVKGICDAFGVADVERRKENVI